MTLAEQSRLDAPHELGWLRWGPYLSERQWGTVREDYSPAGGAWDYLPHDHARSRAYRWGEDGIAGISDDQQRLCLGLALWNGRDPILKERLFGLTNSEGNHGEDVKELYYYLDATPTHSYLKMLYKYPQCEYPYAELVASNRSRGKHDREFELLDTGAFDADRYFDVFVEYAKAGPDDILMLVSVYNRGPEAAAIHVLPQVWFRNTWSWDGSSPKPALRFAGDAVQASHPELGEYRLRADGGPAWLFCENETNARRLYGAEDGARYPKDAFHSVIVRGETDAANPGQSGTKAAAVYRATVPPGGAAFFRLRLQSNSSAGAFDDFDSIMRSRRSEADAFYETLQKDMDVDDRLVHRQALAGLIWSKQYYYFDIPQWLKGDAAQPAPATQRHFGRNSDWVHLNNADIISMPDKWEYPWYAAWDLAFHMIPFAMIDPEFAKAQLVLLTREWYMHPNGQLPAYEWAFGDVNPPVHAWATWRVFETDRQKRRSAGDPEYAGDLAFLERVFHKLMLNFTWWVNRKDAQGRNVFQGGFLGLDNIGVFDRSAPLPTGGFINQADGTSWMAMYSLNLMRIALELALHNPVYEDIATKFFEHFLHIAEAMNNIGTKDMCAEGGVGLWCEDDQFYYDVLNLPDGRVLPLKVSSMVGLIPLFAVETLDEQLLDRLPAFKRRLDWYLSYRPSLAALVSRWDVPGTSRRRLLSLLGTHRLREILRRMLAESEFLSEFGVRSLSRVHRDQPYMLPLAEHACAVQYRAAESDSGAFGGNSNWRGPIWFPVNYLLVESLRKFHQYYGDKFEIECPTGSGQPHTLAQIADELARRLAGIFRRDVHGGRPVLGAENAGGAERCARLHRDPHFCDYPLFHGYFDGDTGRGVGASHQGWTGLVAQLIAQLADPAGGQNLDSESAGPRSSSKVGGRKSGRAASAGSKR